MAEIFLSEKLVRNLINRQRASGPWPLVVSVLFNRRLFRSQPSIFSQSVANSPKKLLAELQNCQIWAIHENRRHGEKGHFDGF